MNKYVDCSKVYVDFIEDKGYSVFAKQNIKQDEIVEIGLARIVETDGNNNPYLFTWSHDKTKWAYASGCATFYNTSLNPNCCMNRDFKNNKYTIVALQDIQKGDELTHLYKSLQWRGCFKKLNEKLQNHQN